MGFQRVFFTFVFDKYELLPNLLFLVLIRYLLKCFSYCSENSCYFCDSLIPSQENSCDFCEICGLLEALFGLLSF